MEEIYECRVITFHGGNAQLGYQAEIVGPKGGRYLIKVSKEYKAGDKVKVYYKDKQIVEVI